jgi:hypothetical protein
VSEIHGEHVIPGRVGVLGGGSASDRTRVVDEDVYRPSSPVELGSQGRHGNPIGEVDGVDLALPAVRLDAAGDVAAALLEVCAYSHDVGACRGQGIGHCEPDSTARASHDRQSSAQIKWAGGHWFPLQSIRTFITPAPVSSALNASSTRSSGSILEISDGAGMAPMAMSSTAASTSARS